MAAKGKKHDLQKKKTSNDSGLLARLCKPDDSGVVLVRYWEKNKTPPRILDAAENIFQK